MQHLLSVSTSQYIERIIEFEFVRATENAALNSIHWLGRGNKEAADEAACDAINGVFDFVDICGQVRIGEGIKDNAPGIFLGDKLGTWKHNSPRFDIALDPIDGTSNIAKGLPNSISVISAAYVPPDSEFTMLSIPSFYSEKLSYGPIIKKAVEDGSIPRLTLGMDFVDILRHAAIALGKRITELVVVILDRPRNRNYIEIVRSQGAALRLISDGDIAAAVAPALPDSGVDLYVGIGGSPEGVLTATALKALGGEILIRMWCRDDAEKQKMDAIPVDLTRIYTSDEVVEGESAIFCATGISDSPLLPGVKLVGNTATTHSILMRARSRTVRYIRAVHNLDTKTIHLRSIKREATV